VENYDEMGLHASGVMIAADTLVVMLVVDATQQIHFASSQSRPSNASIFKNKKSSNTYVNNSQGE
jgi:hypothetical protein